MSEKSVREGLDFAAFGEQVMCLERAFSGYLAYFFKVGLRSDTKGPKRGKEGEGLSPVDIGDRASDPDGDEIQEALTQIVRAYFLADFLAPRPACCHCVCVCVYV